MNIDVRDRVAVVTGAGRGIGREIALALAREGAVTVGTDIAQGNLNALENEFRRESLIGKQIACDVRRPDQIRACIGSIIDDFGRIDILVNNAGVGFRHHVEEVPEDEWDLTIDVNLTGCFRMCKAVVPHMKERKQGRIINAASFGAIIPRCGTAAYASSKAGVVYLTRVLAGELGPWNITVNCFAPGMIPTEMSHYDELPMKDQKRLMDMLTLRRWGEKSDIANLVCFLASDLASYITGAMIDVSGGKLVTQIPREAYEDARSQGVLDFGFEL